MFYSDATQVAQFGHAKLWPIYLYLANQLKYDCARPDKKGGHTLAFLPSVSSCLSTFYSDANHFFYHSLASGRSCQFHFSGPRW